MEKVKLLYFANKDRMTPSVLKNSIVIHWTAIKAPVPNIISYCDRQRKNVNWHYSIGSDGVIWRHLDEGSQAWHATHDWYNMHSIGIEVVFMGDNILGTRICDSLVKLIKDIKTRWNILEITTHQNTIIKYNATLSSGVPKKHVKNCPKFFTGDNARYFPEFLELVS